MTRRLIDLTYPIHEGMTTFPVHWHPIVEVTVMGRHGMEHRETRKLVIGTHTGTHCDAPRHFIPGGGTIDQVPLETLVGTAVVLDLTDSRPGQQIEAAELHTRLGARRPARLLLRFGWDDKWGRMEYYTDHPFLSPAAAQWLADSGLLLLGMDTPMPDNPKHGRGNVPDSPNHKILLGKGVLLVEYLCNLGSLRSSEVELIVMPLKIEGGDGAPARCVAIEDGT